MGGDPILVWCRHNHRKRESQGHEGSLSLHLDPISTAATLIVPTDAPVLTIQAETDAIDILLRNRNIR